MSRKHNDPNQCELDFEAKVDAFTEAGREILEYRCPTIRRDEVADGIETEEELYIGIAAALKQAIRESGMSREEVLEKMNRYLGRGEENPGEPASDNRPAGTPAATEERKRPISIHMLNNYLSKPAEHPPPVRIIHAICRVTRNLAPYEMLVSDCGGTVISSAERIQMLLGKVHEQSAAVSAMKRQLIKELRTRGRGE